ncbi:MAG: hypothetical protein AB7P23_04805 [Amphiplicatus sp.]
MVERLKQIWSGFEGVTARRLTGRGVDNIVAPQRAHDASAPAPADFAPAAAAFEALKARLAASAKKPKRGVSRLDTTPPETSFAPETDAARDLVRGLKATEARLARSDRLYSETAPALPVKRKKFFLF